MTVSAHAAKIMVLEDDRGIAEVVASLFKQENSPRVLVFSIPGNVAVNLLEFNGYHALLMSGHEAVELAQRTPSAVIMLDSAVLNLLLKDEHGGLESRAALSAVSKQQGALLIEDERTAELMQQKIQLQEALTRAERLLQTLGEIARGSLRTVGHAAE